MEEADQIQSLNVINFNKMKEELQKMFEVDDLSSQVGKMRSFDKNEPF